MRPSSMIKPVPVRLGGLVCLFAVALQLFFASAQLASAAVAMGSRDMGDRDFPGSSALSLFQEVCSTKSVAPLFPSAAKTGTNLPQSDGACRTVCVWAAVDGYSDVALQGTAKFSPGLPARLGWLHPDDIKQTLRVLRAGESRAPPLSL